MGVVIDFSSVFMLIVCTDDSAKNVIEKMNCDFYIREPGAPDKFVPTANL